MFTIKQRLPCGTERFWEATDFSVEARYKGDDRPEGYPRFPNWDDRVFQFYRPLADGSSVLHTEDRGDFFVMNDKGTTIDRYYLGQRPPQHPHPDEKPKGQGAGISREEVEIEGAPK